MFKVIEAFSGIGSQAQALANIGIDFEIQATVEWDIAAIYAYDIIHNGPQDLSNLRHHTKTSLLNELSKYSLSNDGSTIVNTIRHRVIAIENGRIIRDQVEGEYGYDD